MTGIRRIEDPFFDIGSALWYTKSLPERSLDEQEG